MMNDDRRTYQISLIGLTPLLMHWDNIDWSDEIKAWQMDPANKKKSIKGDDRSPPWTWTGHVYTDGEIVVMTSDCVGSCLRKAGAMIPMPGGSSNKTFKTETQSGIFYPEPMIPFLVGGKQVSMNKVFDLNGEEDFAKHKEVAKSLGFTLFVKRAKVGQSKHVRVRARFDEWALSFPVEVTEDKITEDILQTLFEYAGAYVGLCDWRPNSPKSPGPYGKFRLTSVEKI